MSTGNSTTAIEVWTTGGGYYLEDTFNFLAMITQGGNWQSMLYFALLIGVCWAVVKILFTGSWQGIGGYVAMVAIVGALGVGPRARVVIMDTTYPLEIYGTVDNVPYAVAFVARFTTGASRSLTSAYEALISAPDDLTYSEHGMLFGARLMGQAARWRAVTPTVANNLTSFMENCMIDGANIGLVDLDDFARSGDLETFIDSEVPLALAYYDSGAATTVSCPDGWEDLKDDLEDEVRNVLMVQARHRAPLEGNSAGVADVNGLIGGIEEFQTMMGMASADATEFLKQSMLIHALDSGAGRLIANSGNAAAMEIYQSARMDAQTRSSYLQTGQSALKWVPLLKIALESLYYAAFPIAMILMLTPLSLAVVRGYFGGYVWLATWEPLSAVLHSMMLKASTGWYREHTTTFTGTNAEDVLNWANQFGVMAVEQEVGAVAGYLMMSVPFLSTVMFFGANRMAGLATSMLNVSQGAAIETGREGATGNVSLGNTSMNTMRANKWDTSSYWDAGRETSYLNDGGMVTTNADGTRTYNQGSAQSNVGMSATVGQTVREELSERLTDSQRSIMSQTEELGSQISSAVGQMSDFQKTTGFNSSSSNSDSYGMSTEERASYQEAWSQVESFAKSQGISTDVALSAILSGQASAKAGLDLKKVSGEVGASLQANGTLSGHSVEDFQRAARAAQNEDFSDTISSLESASFRASSDHSASYGSQSRNSERTTLDKITSTSARLSESFEEAKALETAKAQLDSQDMSYNARITDALITEMQERGYTDSQISRITNPKTTSGVKEQAKIVDQLLPGIMEELNLFKGGSYSAPLAQNSGLYDSGTDFKPLDFDSSSKNIQQPNPNGTVEQIDANRNKVADRVTQDISNTGGTLDNVNTKDETSQSSKEIGQVVDRTVGGEVARRAGGIVGISGHDPVPAIQPTGKERVKETDLLSGSGVDVSFGKQSGPGANQSMSLSAYELDVVTRTVLGEAAGEPARGQAAVAHVIKNRTTDPGYGDDPAEVSLAWKQFSAWNTGAGGNTVGSSADPNSREYKEAEAIVKQVFSGNHSDPTGGATHYWSPEGMQKLVDDGKQTNLVPRWADRQHEIRGEAPVTIGGHIFTGKTQG